MGSEVKPTKSASSDVIVVSALTLLTMAVLWIQHKVTSYGKVTDAVKLYQSFDSFYPFYLSQHENETCRRLHFIGSSVSLLMILFEPAVLPCAVIALTLSAILFQLTLDIPHGAVELLGLFMTFVILMRCFTGSWRKGFSVMSVGYGCAWVGHFFFEMNKPATFTYPTYSLFGDFKMWYEIASRSRPF